MNLAYSLEAQRAWRTLPTWKQSLIKVFGIKYKLGLEQSGALTAPMQFFLFFCDRCEHESKDYTHGFLGEQHIDCSNCGARHDFNQWWIPFAELGAILKVHFSMWLEEHKNTFRSRWIRLKNLFAKIRLSFSSRSEKYTRDS